MLLRSTLSFLALGLLVISCRSAAAGPPAPTACSKDADCRPGPLVNPHNPCCDTGMHLGVFGREYLEWRARFVRERCAKVSCPALPSPALPRPCVLQGRCVAGQCRNRCDEAPGAADKPASAPPPASFSVLLPRPGSPTAWVNFTARRDAKNEWELVGCQTAQRIRACRATRRLKLTPAQASELPSLWAAARRGNFLCRIRISMADWLPFELDWAGGSFKERMPPRRINELARCFPQAHLAWWLLERWTAPR
jgi:hypothetical protein